MKKTMLRQLRNQFCVAVCVLAMSVQFILLENYVNAEVRTTFGEFNNNFVWMYALFFVLGGLVCTLARLRRAKLSKLSDGQTEIKDGTDVSLVLWGIAMILVAFLSVGFVQSLLPSVPVSEITAALPLVYALVLCASALTNYGMFTRLFARVKEDGASLLAPICGGIVVSMVALIIIPRQMSYKMAIVLSGALLILGAFFYAKADNAVKPRYEVRPVERTNDTSGALTLVLLGLMTFGITFLFVNIDNYADKLQFEDIEVYLLIGFCAGGAYAGNAFFKKFGRVSGLLSVIDFVVLTVCMFTVCFVREYLILAFLVLVASVCFAVIVRDIFANIKNWDKMRHDGYRYFIIVVGFIVPMILGYAGGTAATLGHGYMTDIFAGVNDWIADYALRARGAIADAGGNFKEYIGIGTRVEIAQSRYSYVPTRYLPMVPMACMIIGSLFYMVSQIYNIRTSVNDTSKSKFPRVRVSVTPSTHGETDAVLSEQATADIVCESREEREKKARQAVVDKAREMSKGVEFEEVDEMPVAAYSDDGAAENSDSAENVRNGQTSDTDSVEKGNSEQGEEPCGCNGERDAEDADGEEKKE